MSDDPQFNKPAASPAAPPTANQVTPDQIKADLENAADSLNAAAQDVRDTAMSEAQQLKEAATTQLAQAAEGAKQLAADRKNVAADQIGKVSEVIDKVADDLRNDEATAPVARYARDVAGGIRQVSETMRNNSVDDMVAMLQDFGRRQPMALMGASALAGFVASRFIMASAHRSAQGGTTRENIAPEDGHDTTTQYSGQSAGYDGASTSTTTNPTVTNGGTYR